MSKKVALIILDGWGHGDKSKSDVIYHANTPFISGLYDKYPNNVLLTDGENVGLPQGQMGNSEVGHLNIGAGRVVYQDLAKINQAVTDHTIDDNETLNATFAYSKEKNKPLHLMGLISDGGIHSSLEHLLALCTLAHNYGVPQTYIHAFTDGRDTDPKSGVRYIETLEDHIADLNVSLVSVIGRYYIMDRDKRWERVKLGYDLLLEGIGEESTDLLNSVRASYDSNVTDEFIKPIKKVDENGSCIGNIVENDAVICFNFRTDRCREISIALTQQNMPEHNMKTIPLHYTTMTNYDNSYQGVHVIFSKDNLKMTLGEVVQNAGKKQIRIAETEKYPHVTFFFSGGREQEFEGEKRLMVSSPKVATYDLQPEMSALEVTATIVSEIEKAETDFICLNFANPDMVGHTGVYDAITKAVETVDGCTKRVVEAGLQQGYSFIIIADHGNADYAVNEDGSPNTAHTTNPVPVFVIDSVVTQITSGILADVAPTILELMGIDQPLVMTGKSIIQQ